jgi:hypothetical protein
MGASPAGDRLQQFALLPGYANWCESRGGDHRCAVRSLHLFSSSCQCGGYAFLRGRCSTSVFIEAVRCFVVGTKSVGPRDRVDRHFSRDDTIGRQSRLERSPCGYTPPKDKPLQAHWSGYPAALASYEGGLINMEFLSKFPY